MIKIAVLNLKKNVYVAFSINQEYPLATVVRSDVPLNKSEIEQMIKMRFHSQRNEWKKLGYKVESLQNHRGWKFTWWPQSIFWLQPKSVTAEKVETLVEEPGLTITKKIPVENKTEKSIPGEKMGIASMEDGKFMFTEIKGDVIGISQIPEYIANHSSLNND